MNELQILAELANINSEFVVNYKTSWKGNNEIFIQMECCNYDLEYVIESKLYAFFMNKNSKLHPIDYFISTELLKELIESVDYLHSLDPPIVHRDLKPQNILIKFNKNCKRFVKIGDFGISAQQFETMKHTTGVGTLGYIVPEVFTGSNDTKADIYSLGMILQKLIYSSL